MFSLITGLFSSVTGAVAGSTPKFWAILILALALLGTFGYGYYRYTSLVNTVHEQETQIVALKDDVAKKEAELVVVKEVSDRNKKDYENIIKINKDLEQKNRDYAKQLGILEDKLNKAGRDIGYLANMKPQLIENITNKAAAQRKRCLEVISGKPRLKGEKNEVCPNLFVE